MSRRSSRAPSIHEGVTPPVEGEGEGSTTNGSPRSSTLIDTTETLVGDVEKGTITLETKVSAGGANFSQGQRQLIALARKSMTRAKSLTNKAKSSVASRSPLVKLLMKLLRNYKRDLAKLKKPSLVLTFLTA